MPSWLQITFRDIDVSAAVERERARELEQFFDRISWSEMKSGSPSIRQRARKGRRRAMSLPSESIICRLRDELIEAD
jgi:hypothetical protein